jgi:hypothetical protein
MYEYKKIGKKMPNKRLTEKDESQSMWTGGRDLG